MNLPTQQTINLIVPINLIRKIRALTCITNNLEALTYLIAKYELLIAQNRSLTNQLNALTDDLDFKNLEFKNDLTHLKTLCSKILKQLEN